MKQRKKDLKKMFCLCLFLLLTHAAFTQTEISIKQLDPLEKILPEVDYIIEREHIASVARGEQATFQFNVKGKVDIKELKIEVSALSNGTNEIEPYLKAFVGYVKVGRNIVNPSKERLVSLSGYYPDPLLEVQHVDLKAFENQPIWVSFNIPYGIPADQYLGEVRFSGLIDGEPFMQAKQIKAQVFDVDLPEQSLLVTNWFFLGDNHLKKMTDGEGVEKYSDQYWKIVKIFANMMRDHGQNVYMISPISDCKFVLKNGTYSFDFSNFDKMVSVFKEEGDLKIIEGGHLGGRLGNWASEMGIKVPLGGGDFKVMPLDNDSAKNFLNQFIPELMNHLKEKGLEKIYLQHIADEPTNGSNADSYIKIAQLVKQLAPGIKIIEAVHSQQVEDFVDVWVPQLNFFNDDYSFYEKQEDKGGEVWFYTCLGPQGNYANRFIEQPLIQTRLLHWINYRFGATGYLHWGLNYWNDNPYYETTGINEESGNILPGGDCWIVYPSKNKLFSSIRFEAMRDGIADYELLMLLEKKQPQKAKELARTMIYRFDLYDSNIDNFRKKRVELLGLLEEK